MDIHIKQRDEAAKIYAAIPLINLPGTSSEMKQKSRN